MKITFKEVGQGDSIILEWVENSLPKVAVIDANVKKGKINPTLIHLKGLKVASIEFILLTHPHYDHFSGLNAILDYCESNNILIKRFFHTSFNVKECITMAVKGNVARGELATLFRSVHRLKEKGLIEEEGYVMNSSKDVALGEGWMLSFLAPSTREHSEYNTKKYDAALGVKQNNSAANLLSTLIKVSKGNEHFILSSDTVLNVFWELQRKGLKDFGTKLIFGQISHHGAEDNFHGTFWRLHNRYDHTTTVISAGENDYKHPSFDVIKSLEDAGYKMRYTNEPDTLNYSTANISSSLNLISTPIGVVNRQFINSQDIEFEC